MRTYDKTKQSGIEWVGEIPEHWEVKKFKYLNNPKYGFPLDASLFSNAVDEGFPIIRIRDLRENKCETFYQGEIIEDALVDNGDVLISMDGDFHLVQWFGGSAMLNQRICKIISSEKLLKEFYFYIASFPLKVIHDLKFYTTVKHLSDPDLKELPISVPPVSEQIKIVNYLDSKTTEIDQTIADKEALINLFEEEKKALINEAVTKGLNPTVQLKPSGIDWLGDIPEHWEVKKLKYLLRNSKGALKPGPFGSDLKTSDYLLEGNTKVYTQRNVLDNDFEKGNDYISDEKFDSLKVFEIMPDDILVTTRGSIGKAAIFPKNALKGIIHPCLIKIQIDLKKVSNNWLIVYFNESSYFEENVHLESNSTIIDVIYGYTLNNIIIPTPSLEEQKLILKHIETEKSNINEKIKLTKQEIELLKEYRQALIFEAVTGKIKVFDDE